MLGRSFKLKNKFQNGIEEQEKLKLEIIKWRLP